MRRALLVAFQFPPFKASSGLERVLSLARHLPAHGWEPIVLTASAWSYPATSPERIGAVPPGTTVWHVPALDAARHLAVRGRYVSRLALPDRWWSWAALGVPAGLAMIRRHRPDVIWSTYPIATAHVIGHALHRLSGVPWIADFRDPMVEFDPRQQRWFPDNPVQRSQRLAIERRVAGHATAASFCTAGARRIFVDRYGGRWEHDAHVVANGFDEDAFGSLVGLPTAPSDHEHSDVSDARPKGAIRAITLVHSGTIYPTSDRDPTIFLRALARVVVNRAPGARPLRVVLRGSGVELLYASLVAELGLASVVSFEPLVPYQDALREMLAADGLVIFQGHTSNPAIPAKLYEYFRAGRPILALADEAGETARCLVREGIGTLAPLDNEERIAQALESFVAAIDAGHARGMPAAQSAKYERRAAVEQFAALFDTALSGAPQRTPKA